MASDAQKRATRKYRKENTKTMLLRFYPSDMDLHEWVNQQPNKAQYVKSLIRADMEKSDH